MKAAERYEQLWRELAACDELGFDFGFTVEHHFNPNESWMPSPSRSPKTPSLSIYLLERNLAFVGSPKTVAEQIKAAASEDLFNTVLGEFNIGAIAEEDLMRSIKLFRHGSGSGAAAF